MNHCLLDLFCLENKRNKFAKGLPIAFDIVRQRMPKSNPAVGILREHVIVGFLESEFGKANVSVPEDGTKRGYDVVLCGEKLSIKTKTGAGGFKVLWTVDTDYVQRELDQGYSPDYDLLLVQIEWGKKADSVFYITSDVQHDVLNGIGQDYYLSSATGTNNRGIEVRSGAVTKLRNHQDTISMPVDWRIENADYPKPWDEWVTYWGKI